MNELIYSRGIPYSRIKVGGKGDYLEGKKDSRCCSCGAATGHLHNKGCQLEICPVCKKVNCRCSDYENYRAYFEFSTEDGVQFTRTFEGYSNVLEIKDSCLARIQKTLEEESVTDGEIFFSILITSYKGKDEKYIDTDNAMIVCKENKIINIMEA